MGAGHEKRERLPSPASFLLDGGDEPEIGLLGRVADRELRQAVEVVEFPPLLGWDEAGNIGLANQAAAETSGYSIDELVGMPLTDIAGPRNEVERAIADIISGRLLEIHTSRKLRAKNGEERAVYAASRGIDIDGRRGGVSVFIPVTEAGRLSSGPKRSWMDLVPIAVGFADRNWIVRSVSVEIQDLVDWTAEQLRGRSLLDLVDPADAELLRGTNIALVEPRSVPRVRFRVPTGDETEVCVVVAPRSESPGGLRFALVGRVELYFPAQRDRVAELELRLRRIGAEVRAAGLLDTATVPALHDHPELGQLSSRQWEVMSRLLDGKRVPTIAKELFVSQSTVRNHLTTIFRRFGVHTQAELLERLREVPQG